MFERQLFIREIAIGFRRSLVGRIGRLAERVGQMVGYVGRLGFDLPAC